MTGASTDDRNQTRTSYDAVARAYAENISGELDHRPQERHLLQRFAQRCQNLGAIADLGCGPGHISTYLNQFHPDVFGLDFSLGCLAQAQLRNREIPWVQGNMLALPLASGSLAGALGLYSLIHFDLLQVDCALAEMERVLRPGGSLVLGFHVGTNVEHVDELWGVPVNLDARFFLTDDLVARLSRLNFSVLEKFERAPYPEVEYPSTRGYIWAVKQSGK